MKKHLVKRYYDPLKDKKVLCRLCPNECVILNGRAGLCSTRVNIDGKLYSTAYGYPCSIHIDPIEKKPLYHFYPGSKILSFGTYGCNLFCKGCQNFEITRVNATASQHIDLKYYSPEDIVNIAIENKIKFIAYTYNEPTIFFEYMIDIAKLARKKGIKNVIVSNGYINPEPLNELCKYIDAANIDLKGINEKFYKDYARADIKPVLDTIKTLHKMKVWIELTNLVIPELNDNSKDIKKLCEWIKETVGTDVPVHFSRFYPYYHASDISPTAPHKLEEAKTIATKIGIKYVYIGNLGFLDNTICKKCGKTLIEREYNHVNICLNPNNVCPKCQSIIPGFFE